MRNDNDIHTPTPLYIGAGFTLIEISVVLIIIGLLIGGILVGNDLIKSSLIRSQISQIESYNTAALTFKNKYEGLPGDLKSASGFGFPDAQGYSTAYAVGSNPGDGLIMSCHNDSLTTTTFPPYGYIAFSCENSMFWTHLSMAYLIGDKFTRTDNATAFIVIAGSQKDLYVPKAEIPNNYVFIYAWNGVHYFHLVGIGSQLSNVNGTEVPINKITPLEAFQIDSKLDDGLPTSGKVLANDYVPNNIRINLTAGSPTVCRNAANGYNISSAVSNDPLCQLRFKADF